MLVLRSGLGRPYFYISPYPDVHFSRYAPTSETWLLYLYTTSLGGHLLSPLVHFVDYALTIFQFFRLIMIPL